MTNDVSERLDRTAAMSGLREKCAEIVAEDRRRGVRPGDRVIDTGCRLAERIRETNGELAPIVTVVAIFPWGLRVRDDAGELYDCGRWEIPQ